MPRLPKKRVTYTDIFRFEDELLPGELAFEPLDFWRWYISDLCENTTRGGFGEFLVARALGIHDKDRAEWENYDLETEDGTKIEVKTTGYVQTWHKTADKNSSLSWDVEPKEDSYGIQSGKRRWSDVYVFCLNTEKAPERYDALDLSKWCFWVVPTAVLNSKIPTQKSVSSIRRLEEEWDAQRIGFIGLRDAILRAATHAKDRNH